MTISKSASRVQEALTAKGIVAEVVELPASTRTADDAAKAIGCTKQQIVKSLIFKTEHSHQPVLLLVSGVNRVNEKRIASYMGENIIKADADFAAKVTGFAIGGIPPLGHAINLKTFIDKDLMQYDEVWAAAGTPNAVFRVPGKISALVPEGKIVAVTGE